MDGEEDLDPDNASSVLNTVLNTIDKEFEHAFLDDAVRLLNAQPIRPSTDDCAAGQKYSIPDLFGTRFLAHQVWAIWFIVRRWVWDTVMPGVDEMGLGKTFISVAAAMLCKLVTEKVIMGLPLSIIWLNTLPECVNQEQNNYPGIIADEQKWYPLWRQNSVLRHLSEIQSTPPLGHAALTS